MERNNGNRAGAIPPWVTSFLPYKGSEAHTEKGRSPGTFYLCKRHGVRDIGKRAGASAFRFERRFTLQELEQIREDRGEREEEKTVPSASNFMTLTLDTYQETGREGIKESVQVQLVLWYLPCKNWNRYVKKGEEKRTKVQVVFEWLFTFATYKETRDIYGLFTFPTYKETGRKDKRKRARATILTDFLPGRNWNRYVRTRKVREEKKNVKKNAKMQVIFRVTFNLCHLGAVETVHPCVR